MNHRFHQTHFVEAWNTVRKRNAFWMFGPLVALIGSASVFDYVFGTMRTLRQWHVASSSTLVDVWRAAAEIPWSAQISLMVAITLIAAVMLVIQGAVVRGLYAHKRSRVQIHDAFTHGWKRLRATAGITLLTLAPLVIVLSLALALLTTLDSYNPLWNTAFNILVYGLSGIAVFILFSVELIALTLALGANKPATEAVGDAWNFVRRYPVLIVEHNIILAVIYIISIAVLLLLVLAFAVPFALPFLTLALTLTSLPNWIGFLPLAILALCGWLVLGFVTLYNYATWAALTHRLVRQPHAASRFAHTARTYIPLFR